jgi:hypothetical protein
MSGRRALAVLVIVVGIALGAVREFLFLNLNYQIDHVARRTAFSYAHSLFQEWVHGMDLDALRRLKWVLAIAFIAVMAALTLVLARVLSGSFRHARAILLWTAAFAVLALVLHLLARRMPPLEQVSVQVLHMLQYPVPLLFVLAAFLRPRPRT